MDDYQCEPAKRITMTDPSPRAEIRLEARPPRDTRIDIIRGWLQLTIFASHAAGSWIGAWLIHGAWGLSDSSEQFVFLSGLMLGSVFARKAAREGFPAAAFDMAKRTARLYRTHLITFFLFGGMIIAVTNSGLLPGEVKRLGWSFLVQHPARAIPAALTTLYQPNYMDILPIFIWSMAALPAFAWLERRIGVWALLPSIALYLAAWLFGLIPPSLGPDTVIGFNPLAWQVLFMLGAFLGRRMLRDWRTLPPSRPLLLAAVAVLAVGLLLRLSWFGWLPFDLSIPESDWIIGKDALALPRVLHALALALVVARLTPREAPWMHTTLARWLAAAGRHSLHVFCLGLFLSWGVTAAFRLWPTLMVWLDAPLILTGCVILLWFGMWRDRGRNRPLPARDRPVGSGRLA
jgi:hypothetical protein